LQPTAGNILRDIWSTLLDTALPGPVEEITMKAQWFAALIASLSLFAAPAFAALSVGAAAPDFTTEASMGGKVFTYTLSQALKKGPVVLYFYPAAFTKGCTIEAHDFAAAMAEFERYGASVIGVSSDPVDVLNRFSVSECRSKFPVASDADLRIIKAYDAVLLWKTHYAKRISYVVTPDDKVAYSYADMNPDHHVANTLAVVRRWAEAHGK
jgi:peroxiredoxin Q/BCP